MKTPLTGERLRRFQDVLFIKFTNKKCHRIPVDKNQQYKRGSVKKQNIYLYVNPSAKPSTEEFISIIL